MKTHVHFLFVLLCTVFCSVTGHSQINYSQNFESGAGGWEDWDFYPSSDDACGSAGFKGYFYNDPDWGDSYAPYTTSPVIGTSNGLATTLTYTYRITDYFGDGLQGEWGNATVEYSTSLSGPWTNIHTITPANNTSVNGCAVKTATITTAAGTSIYLKVTMTPMSSDYLEGYIIIDDVSLVQALPACSGTPAASAATVLNGPVCAQQNASVALTPAYASSGLTYQWQGSVNGTTFTNIPGATAATLSATQAQGPWYRAVVTCANGGASTTSAAVQATFAATACVACPIEFDNNVEPITSVVFSNLTNVSGATVNGTPDVENFTSLPPANVTTGQSYTFSAQGNTDGNYDTYIKVYIDFNKNGNLNDPGESFSIGDITNSTGIDGVTASAPIFIPTNASTGITTMRVFKLYGEYSANPCGTDYGFGQVEDYLVNITQCTTVAPVAAATQTVCGNATVANLTATGTGIKWYAAASGGAVLPATQALVNGTVYYASQTNVCEGSARTAVTVTITVVPVDDPADVTNCGPYTLPALTNGTYRTATGGGGTAVAAGTAVNTTTTLYVYNTVGACSAENSVLITISNPVADEPADVTACGTYTLPALTNGVYRTATAGGGTVVAAGTAITTTTTLYVYAGTATCNAENSFTVTINNAVVDTPQDVTECTEYALPELVNGNYYTSDDAQGDMLNPGDVITETQMVFVYASVGDCVAQSNFTVTITNFEVDQLDDVTVCGSYVLPELTTGSYYTGGSGLGEMLEAGDVVTETMTIHVYGTSAVNPDCTDDKSFTVTVITVEADELDDVETCSDYTLPLLSAGNMYYTGPEGTGSALSAGDVIASTQTIYIQAASSVLAGCTAETSFEVVVTPLDTPADILITIENTSGMPAIYYLGDVEIEPGIEGEITVYASEEDALAGVNPLDETAEISGTATFYATVTVGDCTTAPFAVTVDVVLDTKGFDMAAFSYYPNPVADVLNLHYSENITGVQVFSIVGQQVVSAAYNESSVKLDLSQLASGTYIVKVSTENASKTIKVVKNK